MNRRDFIAGAVLVPALLPAQADEGFAPLFDGSTLRGWSIQEGPESAFYIQDNAIVVHEGSSFPTWLRSEKRYENFDFRCEFFVEGWINSGIYLHAPEHGRNIWVGMKINIFHQQDKVPQPESMGSIFPLVPPLKVNARNRGEWNALRVFMDWPLLRVWVNEEIVQDLNVETIPELWCRLRSGYLGLESLSYPIRFRNLRIKELPSKEHWETLYEGPEDFHNWFVSEGRAKWQPIGDVLWVDGVGHLATRKRYKDFELHLYVRHSKHHNGGVLFRSAGKGLGGANYEIQLHDVEGAHYPTGSLYYFKRAVYPRIEAEKWFLMQLMVRGNHCRVRINGENVLGYDQLENLGEGHIELQTHHACRWTEFKQIRIKQV
jgi:hypothetical protein